MRDSRLVALRSGGIRCDETHDPGPEINRQAKNRPELDHDREHLPVAVAEVDAEYRLRYAQVSGGADGQEFRESFNDAENDGKKIVVQTRHGSAPALMVVQAPHACDDGVWLTRKSWLRWDRPRKRPKPSAP